MQFSDNGTTWTAPEPFAPIRPYNLPSPNVYGARKVFARFVDSAGKASAPVTDTITYAASAAASSSMYMELKNGDAYTTTTTVPLIIANPDASNTFMRISMNGTTWTLWETAKASKSVVLPAGDGVKTVYVQFKTAGGALSAVYSDSIILDTIAPKGTIQINGGAYSTNTRTVTATLTPRT